MTRRKVETPKTGAAKVGWTGVPACLAWSFSLLLAALLGWVGFLMLVVSAGAVGEVSEVWLLVVMVPFAIAAAWQALRAPAMGRRLSQVALLAPLVGGVAAISVASAMLADPGYVELLLVGGYVLVALTVHLGWSLPWASTMAYLSRVKGGRLLALWALALFAPLAVGLDLLVSLIYVRNMLLAVDRGTPVLESLPTREWQAVQLLALTVVGAVALVSWRVRRANPLPAKLPGATRPITDVERAAAVDPRALLARDLLGWKRRFLLLPAVGIAAAAWPLATHIALVKREAQADRDALLADYPRPAPDLASEAGNGLLRIQPFLQDAPTWTVEGHSESPLHYDFPMRDPSAYAEGSILMDFIVASQPLYESLPGLLASPDHSRPSEYPMDYSQVQDGGKIGYMLAARLHLHCYRQDWPAVLQDFALIGALDDYSRTGDSAESFREASFYGYFSLGMAERTLDLWLAFDIWSIPAPVLETLRAGYLDRLAKLPDRADIFAKTRLNRARFRLAWTTALGTDRTYSYDERRMVLVPPLLLSVNALHYRWRRDQFARAEQQIADRVAATVAAEHYLGRTRFQWPNSAPFTFLLVDGPTNIGNDEVDYMDYGLHNVFIDRLARYRQELARIDAVRFRVEHGRFPTDMAELGEPELRRDPYSPTDAPFGCRVDAHGRFRIWSAGWDQRDDNGWISSDPRSETGGRGGDTVVLLCPPGWRGLPYDSGPTPAPAPPVQPQPTPSTP